VTQAHASHVGGLPPTPAAAFALGMREMLPGIPAMAAWSLVTGVAMAKSALSLGEAMGLSLIAYAGAAQLAALPLLVASAPIVVTVMSALMVNLRFVIYSAAVAPSLRSLPLRQRLLLGYMLSDMGFVFYMRREPALRDSPMRAWYFAGLGVIVFFVWHTASLVGLFAAAAIPESWGLDFVGTLALLALLVPMLATRPSQVGGAVAAVLSLWLRGLPFKLGVVVSIVAGIGAAVVADRRARPLP
jgi:predicted branched-subunit amino acid permease